ncbi:MAG: TPM domain-containing protein [Desulfobacteraceae bacterium]|nr:TPM domain-containing protein [Desulfobacteraceae bacterium]
MKKLAQRFLSPEEKAQVEAAVGAAEKETSGEIVCLIQSASYHYPMANVIGATLLSLPLSLVLTPAIGGFFWIGTQNMWLFIGIFGLLFAAFYLLIDRIPALKRRFIARTELEEEVQEAAMTSFIHHGLYRTRDANGILIYISVFERKVWVLADRGIHAKVANGQWDGVVARITEGIRQKKAATAICEAVAEIGAVLKTHFPIKADDTNELRNVIVAG